ncbi:MAG TPA: chorismate synthase [Allosphingosinicella sp.]|jgi:chorismate synthase|nr:chorismate synthase [Allosphingosinicella sp.]
MSFNSFGRIFRFTTWGESHGPAIGVVVDGCPPGLDLSEADIQPWLHRRRPGTSMLTSPRKEPDRVRILSGVFEGRTTGTPISLIIDNEDRRSEDYRNLASAYRPGHADYAYEAKYGLRDWRGGGRASARETAARVAAAAVARLVIPEVTVSAQLVEIGGESDAARWESLIGTAREEGTSLGGIVACEATGVPAGWGAPVYAKLDAELAAAVMSINAVKGVEIGEGFAAAAMRGHEHADEMRPGLAGPDFLSNHGGGIAGGISTGQPIRLRAAFKPPSSISRPMRSVNSEGAAAEVRVEGRHDPCVAIRGAPVVEAMVALVLADHKLLHRAQCGG